VKATAINQDNAELSNCWRVAHNSGSGADLEIAVAWSENWARAEAAQWARWANINLPGGTWDAGDVYGQIALIWMEVKRGQRGKFLPKANQGTVAEQLHGYVVQCLKNDLRAMRMGAANPTGIRVQRPSRVNPDYAYLAQAALSTPVCLNSFEADGEQTAGERFQEEDAIWYDEASATSDPLDALLEHEAATVHPTRLLAQEAFREAMDEAEAMCRRDAAALRVRTPGGRINAAWAILRTLQQVSPNQVEKLAPIMHARWCLGAGGGTKILHGISPALAAGIDITDVVKAEARNLLVCLASLLGAAVLTRSQFDLVLEDAAAAMKDWRGKRGPYKKRSGRSDQASRDMQETLWGFNDDDCDEQAQAVA
jgi:hypothetical protein